MSVATITRTVAETPPSAEELLARARRVSIAIKDSAAEADELRRVPDSSVALMKEHGLLRVIQPKRAGGYEMSMRSHLDVIATLAEGCSSAAWIAGVVHAHSWMLGHYPEQALQEVYGDDPDTLVAAVIGPRGKAVRHADGSHTLEGFWPFGSGCQHADWLILGAEVSDEAGNAIEHGDMIVPADQIEIRDDWYVAGLQGTGSNSMTGKGVVVPAHRYLGMPDLVEHNTPGLEGYDGWLYRAEAVPVLAVALTGTAMGLARSMVPDFMKAVKGKSLAYTDYRADEYTGVQIALAEAATKIDCAEFLLYRVVDDIDRFAQAGERMDMTMRGRIRMDCAAGVRLCMEAADLLFHRAGASGLSLRGTMQRAWRDIHAINMHGLLGQDIGAEVYGRIMLGQEPGTPTV